MRSMNQCLSPARLELTGPKGFLRIPSLGGASELGPWIAVRMAAEPNKEEPETL